MLWLIWIFYIFFQAYQFHFISFPYLSYVQNIFKPIEMFISYDDYYLGWRHKIIDLKKQFKELQIFFLPISSVLSLLYREMLFFHLLFIIVMANITIKLVFKWHLEICRWYHYGKYKYDRKSQTISNSIVTIEFKNVLLFPTYGIGNYKCKKQGQKNPSFCFLSRKHG